MKEKKTYQTPSLDIYEICDNDILTSSKPCEPFDLDSEVIKPGGNEKSFNLPGEKF